MCLTATRLLAVFLRSFSKQRAQPMELLRPGFGVIVVHTFSRFFRDQFQLESYLRRLAKSGVRLMSITPERGGQLKIEMEEWEKSIRAANIKVP